MPVTQKHIDKAIEIAKSYNATKLLLFGSALNDPANANDLDLACEGVDNAKFFHLAAEIEDAVMLQVDLVPLDHTDLFINYIKKYGRFLI
ncbi:nucleotidyltransferase family protein [Bacteroidota bacterium]